MIGQPGVSAGRQAGGEHPQVAARDRDGRTEQWVSDGTEARRAHLTAHGEGTRPEPLPLEGVGRQADIAWRDAEYAPVDGESRDVQGGQCGGDGGGLGVPGAQQRRGHRYLDRRECGQAAVGTEFQHGGHARVAQAGQPVVEPDGLTGLAHPVLR